MNKAFLATSVLLLAAVATEAATSRDLLARSCDDQKQLKCGGRCVNFLMDPNNCGACNLKCDKTHVCVQGGCVCPSRRPQECGLSRMCTNVQIDPMNCGSCGNLCPSGKCANGKCVGSDDNCSVDEIKCNGVCRHIFWDEKNCGDCGVVCKGGSICIGGGCVCPPNKPDICEENVCTNTQSDAKNCGFCFNKCQRGEQCIKGKCV